MSAGLRRRAVQAAAAALLVLGLWRDARGQIWEAISTGLGVITGVAEVGGWIKSAFSTTNSADIEWPLAPAIDAELGLTLVVPFKAKFSFEDGYGTADYGFAEIYVSLNKRLLHFQRYPQTGFITNPDNWFDDSQTVAINGKVYIGLARWPCGIPTDEIEVDVLVFRDAWAKRDGTDDRGTFIDTGQQYIGNWVEGQGLITTSRIQLLRRLADAHKATDVSVHNPYFVHQVASDNGVTKNHHGPDFFHHFRAHMNYAFNYPSIQVRDPDLPVNIAVNGLPSKGGWGWGTGDPLQFTFVAGQLRKDVRDIRYVGRHGDPATHHPGQEFMYADDWGADVSGSNVIFYKSGANLTAVPYNFATPFVPRANSQQGCTPIPFEVKDNDPHSVPAVSTTGGVALLLLLMGAGVLFLASRRATGSR